MAGQSVRYAIFWPKIIKEEFQNESETLKIWYRIFGKKSKLGIPDKKYPDDSVFMKRIERRDSQCS